jgi:catechol 2,3-dioxygenase-like lactoylglutathione lyase family enzyme
MPAMLVVSDLRASIEFYTGVVGLELVDRTASASALQQQQVHDEDELCDGDTSIGEPSALLHERVGAGPTRSELQRLDWAVMTGASGVEVGSIQAATLRHADGTWLRLLQLGSAYNARGDHQASVREQASSAEQRTSNTAGAMDAAAGAADLGAAAVLASESAAQLALAAVSACEAVLEAATEASAESEGGPLAMVTINYAAAAQQAAALCAEAATAAELAALNASNAATMSTNYSAETRSWQATETTRPSTPSEGGAGIALCFFVSEPELDDLVSRLAELQNTPWEEAVPYSIVKGSGEEPVES